MSYKRTVTYILFIGLISFFSLFYTHQLGFINVDLPRHIKNGQVILENLSIPQTNLYSYTHPDYPTVMHHWGAGIIFYLLVENFGFAGFQLVMVGVITLTFLLLLRLATKISSSEVALFLGVVALPLITTRNDIRPELFSFLFLSISLTILWSMFISHWKKYQLSLLMLVQLLWVNTHVFFVFGICLPLLFLGGEVTASFLNQNLKSRISYILRWLLLSLSLALVSLINPFGIEGILAPFTVLTDIQNFVIENMSIFTYLQYFPTTEYYLFLVLLIATSLMIVGLRDKIKDKSILISILLLGVFGVLGLKMIRAVSLFGLVLIPASSVLLQHWLDSLKQNSKINYSKRLLVITSVVLLFSFMHKAIKQPMSSWVNIGLNQNVSKPAEFLLANEIEGPIVNNFNSGGYLAYYLYPKEKIYVDARAEAYSDEFFYSEYIPIENDEKVWQELNQKYGFNVIFAEISAQEPEWLEFLTRRKNDQDWILIYQDSQAVIFVRNVERNQEIIKKFSM